MQEDNATFFEKVAADKFFQCRSPEYREFVNLLIIVFFNNNKETIPNSDSQLLEILTAAR